MFTCKNNSKHNNNNSLCFNFSLQKNVYSGSKSNMGIYNFICGPRSYDAFPKWPARSFGLATPALNNSLTHISFAGLKYKVTKVNFAYYLLESYVILNMQSTVYIFRFKNKFL